MNLVVATSTTKDGNMAITKDQSNKDEVIQNRRTFLSNLGINMEDATRVIIVYEGENYRRYREVDERDKATGMFNGDGAAADALVTRTPGQALFLPLADCVGTTIYDPEQQVLMLSHVGRHSLEQSGAETSVKYLVDNYGCHPEDLLVWLTPAPGKERYPLYAFDNRSFKDVVFEQLQTAGIRRQNITDDPTDTTNNPSYYSHSEFLAGRQADDGRYAMVAMMQP